MYLCLLTAIMNALPAYGAFNIGDCLKNLHKEDNIDKSMDSCIKKLAEQKAEKAAQELKGKDIDVNKFKKELKNKLIEAGKKVWNKYKDKYKNIAKELNQAQDKLNSLKEALDNALQKAKNNFVNKIKQMDEFEGNVEETAQTIIDQADKKEPSDVEKFFGRFNVQRFYFNGSAQSIAKGVFPEVWVVTGVGDDSHCAHFQFNANKPVQSIHEINTELVKLLIGDESIACENRPVPKYSC